MLQDTQTGSQHGLAHMKIEDFGLLQARYQPMKVSARAKAVLEDAQPALQVAERVLNALSSLTETKASFDKLRKNGMLMGKLRPSDARVALMDSSCDFIKETTRKLATWRKTLERLAAGEGVGADSQKDYIRSDEPVALAVAGAIGISNFISIVQLALMDISKLDSKNAATYSVMTAEIRRCATVLSDYENAAAFQSLVR